MVWTGRQIHCIAYGIALKRLETREEVESRVSVVKYDNFTLCPDKPVWLRYQLLEKKINTNPSSHQAKVETSTNEYLKNIGTL